MPSAFSLLCLYSSAFPFLWNVLSSLAISTHSSLKTQLKCQLVPQPDVIFVWVPTTQCTLSWHLTFPAVLCIWRGSSFQMSYRWSSHSSPLRECQSHPSHGHLLFHCRDSRLTSHMAFPLPSSVSFLHSSKCEFLKCKPVHVTLLPQTLPWPPITFRCNWKLTWPSGPCVIWPHLSFTVSWSLATLVFLLLEYSISALEPFWRFWLTPLFFSYLFLLKYSWFTMLLIPIIQQSASVIYFLL